MMKMMAVAPEGSERRRSPRIDVNGRLRASVLVPAQDVVVRDLSLGGFLIEGDEAFAVDALHQFRVAGPNDEWTTILTARSVYCRPVEHPDGVTKYLTGFAFSFPHGREAWRCVHKLIDRETSVIAV
jgi:hypothetical protein